MAFAGSPPGPQEWVISYLKAQAKSNINLECDSQRQILYDKNVVRQSSSVSASSSGHLHDAPGTAVQTAVVSTFMTFPWSPICFTPYVGPGMLAAAVVPYSESTSNSAFFHEAQYHSLAQLMGLGQTEARTHMKSILNIRTMSGNVPAPLDSFDSVAENLHAKTLQVGDEVSIDVSSAEPAENREDYEDNHPSNAGIILVMKVCGALAAQGHDCETVHKVGKLVADNLVTAYQHQVLNMHFAGDEDNSKPTIPVLEEDIETQKKEGLIKPLIGKMLRMLLDPTLKRSRTVHMNSNEIVLLINDLGEIDGVSLRAVAAETMQQLQKNWNIWPVRVYAGHFMESHITGFSVTLLNVVNTDIGGPSMVQLLDEPCGAMGWKSFAVRETWYGHRLISRDEQVQPSLVPDRDLELSLSRDGIEEMGYSLPSDDDEQSIDEIFQHGENVIEEEGKTRRQVHKSIDNSLSPPDTITSTLKSEIAPDLTKKPESPPLSPMTESVKAAEALSGDVDDLFPIEDVASHKEEPPAKPTIYSYEVPERPAIVHPTWKRADTDRSLVDLIRQQASKLEMSNKAKSATSSPLESPVVAKPKTVGDEDFEFV